MRIFAKNGLIVSSTKACDLFGKDIENGKLPASEMDFIGRMIEDICYNNAKNYFTL